VGGLVSHFTHRVVNYEKEKNSVPGTHRFSDLFISLREITRNTSRG
jgi:hypothetical protein